MRFELHCHSICSDGELTPKQVAEQAANAGPLAAFALTDHDTCAGSEEAVAAALPTIRAVEMSCDWGGRTVHVLAFSTSEGHWSVLEQRLADVRAARRGRFRQMAARLAQRGISVDAEPVLQAAGDRAIGRPDLARLLVTQGVVGSLDEAFSKHLYDGGPVDLPHHNLPIEEALAVAGAAQARCALAHPHLYGKQSEALVRRYREAGLGGIEAYYARYDAQERQRWRRIAKRFDLVCTGGSDFHRPGDPSPGVELEPADAAQLANWLALPIASAPSPK